jgi:molybdopterin-guanine dinucleotide biosynthesis protein A
MNSSVLAAALIAGGASKRMGRDKAMLPVMWRGREVPLWYRQLAVLKMLHPDELIISGPSRAGLPSSVAVLPDRQPGKGPLSGIAICLESINSDWLVALAVDLPFIGSKFLQQVLQQREASCGVVPVMRGRFEPLAAVYPKSASTIASKRLEHGDLKLQGFVAELIELELVRAWDVPEDMAGHLVNWNLPPVM